MFVAEVIHSRIVRMIFGMLGRGIDSAWVGREEVLGGCSIQEHWILDVLVENIRRLRSAYLKVPSHFRNDAGNTLRGYAPCQHKEVGLFEASQLLEALSQLEEKAQHVEGTSVCFVDLADLGLPWLRL